MRKKTKLMKRLRKNKNGGIEGLPMQLMIIVVIATLGMGLMVGWMNGIEAPKSIGDVEVESGRVSVSSSNAVSPITIRVTDQDGNPLEGATVVITGLGVNERGQTPHKTTNADGKVSFNGLRLSMTGKVGYLTINVSKPGYGEDNSCKITVVR
ncbi:MAG: carboxypeptidase regulatory-like domain-containing protein [Thermoplasmatales archaeon]|nr:carboxypeptidase regulatory-like domain-containing protein [Thermoplasmatales archaeon]